MNLYTYCHNNPIYGIDPSGHWLNFVVGAVVGGVVGGAITAYSTWKKTGEIDWSDTLVSAGVGALEGVIAASGYGILVQALLTGTVAFSGDLLSTSIDCAQNNKEVQWGKSLCHATAEGTIGAGCSVLGSVSADILGKSARKFSNRSSQCSKLYESFECSKGIGKKWNDYNTMKSVAEKQEYLWKNKLRAGKHAAKDMRKAQRASEKIMSQINTRTNYYQGYSSVTGTIIGTPGSTGTNYFMDKYNIFGQE